MPVKNQNGEIWRGAAAEIQVTVTDKNGAPLPLAGKEVHYRIAKSADAPTALFIPNGSITKAGNVATVPITPAESEGLRPVNQVEFYHELYLIEGDIRDPVMTGTLTVHPAQVARHD